MWNGVLQLKRS